MHLTITEQKLEPFNQDHAALIKRWIAKAELYAKLMSEGYSIDQYRVYLELRELR